VAASCVVRLLTAHAEDGVRRKEWPAFWADVAGPFDALRTGLAAALPPGAIEALRVAEAEAAAAGARARVEHDKMRLERARGRSREERRARVVAQHEQEGCEEDMGAQAHTGSAVERARKEVS
jgi:hypothetical protein